MERRAWQQYELEYLRTNWPRKSDAEIAAALGRTETAIRTIRYQKGICINPADWTTDQDSYIVAHWTEQSNAELGAAVGKSAGEAYQRGVSLGLVRRRCPETQAAWTTEDIEYLTENWGVVSVGTMCKKLQRTKAAIVTKKNRLGLGSFLDSGAYVTLSQLITAVTGSNSNYGYKMKSWIEKRKMPIHEKLVDESRFRVVYLDEFWKWAEKNRSFLDLSKMEPFALGKEPKWVAEQRRKDFGAFSAQRKDPWTQEEDSRLVMLLKQYKYGYAELSDTLQRSAGAIQRRISDLGLKERPIKADNRDEWTAEHYCTLADGIRGGDSYTKIGKAVGRSEKAVRGKAYFVYLTENADKIRAMMGHGAWGDGAPEPTVKQGTVLSRCRTSVRKDLTRLAGLLAYRRNQLGYEPYWQKTMCVHWHDIKGCTADGTDCDSCTVFQRIKPQYCARCGCTFYEREENRFCGPCRVARKKAAQRKYATLCARAR